MADCAPRTIARAETIPRKLVEVSSRETRGTFATIERFLRTREKSNADEHRADSGFSQCEVDVIQGQIRFAQEVSVHSDFQPP